MIMFSKDVGSVEDSNYLYMLILLTLLFSFTLPAMIQITALKCWSNVRCLVFQMMILVATLMISYDNDTYRCIDSTLLDAECYSGE